MTKIRITTTGERAGAGVRIEDAETGADLSNNLSAVDIEIRPHTPPVAKLHYVRPELDMTIDARMGTLTLPRLGVVLHFGLDGKTICRIDVHDGRTVVDLVAMTISKVTS